MLQLSNKAQAAIVAMAKALPKDNPRNYANVIGIRNGKACITDGFGLLEYRIEGTAPGDMVLKRDLFPSEVKFPAWEQVIPSTGQEVSQETCMEILELISAIGAKLVNNVYLALAGDKAWIFKSRTNTRKSDASAFNPWIAKNLLKAMPKGAFPTGGKIHDGCLRIDFENYSLVMIAVRIND